MKMPPAPAWKQAPQPSPIHPVRAYARPSTHNTKLPNRASQDFNDALRQARASQTEAQITEPVRIPSQPDNETSQDPTPQHPAPPTHTDAKNAQTALSDVDHQLHHSLLSQPSSQGQFELLLPMGHSIGVTYDMGPGSTHVMLEARSRILAKQLKSRTEAISQSLSQRSSKEVHVVAI